MFSFNLSLIAGYYYRENEHLLNLSFCFRFVFEDQIEFIKASVMEGDEVWLKLWKVTKCSCEYYSKNLVYFMLPSFVLGSLLMSVRLNHLRSPRLSQLWRSCRF